MFVSCVDLVVMIKGLSSVCFQLDLQHLNKQQPNKNPFARIL